MYDVVKYIENYYGINVNEFISLYKDGLSRKELAKYFDKSEFVVRTIAGLLGLRLKKKFRNQDYLSFIEKMEGKKEILSDIIKENDILNQSIYKLNKQLQSCRDKNILLQKQLRITNRNQNIYDEISKEIKEALTDCIINVNECKPVRCFDNQEGLSIVCLSDLHIGAKVEAQDVGYQNEFNFDIAKKRMDKVFNVLLSDPYVSNRIQVVLLGDIFDGIVHQSNLIAEMPVMEAIVKLSQYLASKLIELITIFSDVKVDIVTGNHERSYDVQDIYKKGFDFTYIFYELLKNMVPNVSINYHIFGYGLIDLPNNEKGFIFHGDIDRSYKSFSEQMQLKAIANCKNIYGIEPKLLLSGHTHQYSKSMMYNGGYAITVGTLMGTNSYSYNKGYLSFIPSQVLLFYSKDGELVSERVVEFRNE